MLFFLYLTDFKLGLLHKGLRDIISSLQSICPSKLWDIFLESSTMYIEDEIDLPVSCPNKEHKSLFKVVYLKAYIITTFYKNCII